jgi:hypothetical protein
LAEIASGDFSGHRSFSAGKKRGFCQLRLRKTLGAISADIALFPLAKSVVFASCACARLWGRFQRTSFFFRWQKAWFLPAAHR